MSWRHSRGLGLAYCLGAADPAIVCMVTFLFHGLAPMCKESSVITFWRISATSSAIKGCALPVIRFKPDTHNKPPPFGAVEHCRNLTTSQTSQLPLFVCCFAGESLRSKVCFGIALLPPMRIWTITLAVPEARGGSLHARG